MMTIITAVASLGGAILFFLGGLFAGRGKGSPAPTAGMGNADSAALEARVFEAEQGLAQARQTVVEKNEQLNIMQQNITQLEQGLAQAQQQASAAAAAPSGADQENARLKNELKRVQGEAANREAEHRKATAALQQTQAKLRQMERELTNAKNSAADWEVKTEDVSNVNSKLAEVLEENKRLRAELHETRNNPITVSKDNPFISSDAGGLTDESRGEPTALVYEMDRLRAENNRLRQQLDGAALSDAPTASEVRMPDFPRGNTTQVPRQVSAVQKEPTHTSTQQSVYPPSSEAAPTKSRTVPLPGASPQSQTASSSIPLPGAPERSKTASSQVALPGSQSQTASTSIPLPGRDD